MGLSALNSVHRGRGRGAHQTRPYVVCSADSLWDTTRAPENKHIVGVGEFSAPRRRFSENEWRGVKQRFTDNMLRAWASYAPNMTIDNVTATRVYSRPGIGRGSSYNCYREIARALRLDGAAVAA